MAHNKYMKYIFQILLIAICAVLFFTYIMPEYKSVKALRVQVVEYDNSLDNSKELQQKRDEILLSYNTISATNKERISRLLPDLNEDSSTKGSVALILEMDEIALQNGLKITNLGFTNPQASSMVVDRNSKQEPATNDYSTSTISFKTQASYANFILFMKDLEKNLRVVDIKSISFSAPKITKDNLNLNTGLFEYNVLLQAYWLNI